MGEATTMSAEEGSDALLDTRALSKLHWRCRRGLLENDLFIERFFCRYLCPLGAIYGFFNPIAFYRFRVKEDKCTKCGLCQKACKMDIPVYRKPNSMECIRCGDCLKACPFKALERERPGRRAEKIG